MTTRPDWERENPDEEPVVGEHLCAVCRQPSNMAHGYLIHDFITYEKFMDKTPLDRYIYAQRLLQQGVAIVEGSPLMPYAPQAFPDVVHDDIVKNSEGNIASTFTPADTFDLNDFQQAVGAWCRRNFGIQSDLVLYGGTAEEVGEVLRGAVKREQGIRGTREEWEAVMRAEMGDVVIKLASACAQEGWSLTRIIRERWAEVQQRDWTINRTGHGLPEDES